MLQKKQSDVGEIRIVLGNESCDLDSAVSALVYSLYLHKVSEIPRGNFVGKKWRKGQTVCFHWREDLICLCEGIG